MGPMLLLLPPAPPGPRTLLLAAPGALGLQQQQLSRTQCLSQLPGSAVRPATLGEPRETAPAPSARGGTRGGALRSILCRHCQGNGAVVCRQCQGGGVNLKDHFGGRFKEGQLCRWQVPSRRGLTVRGSTGLSDAEQSVEGVEENAMERMEKSLESVRGNFNTVRTGRASPSLLDRVEVEYYGSPVALKSIAQVSTPDGTSLLITPFDKSSIKAIEKALLMSDVGLTPNSDGTVIRLSIPQLTQERRKELLKTASKLAEEGKVAIRNVRRDALKAYDKMEKEKRVSEDGKKGLAESLQKLTDDYIKQIDTLFKQKEKELLSV